MKEAQRQQYLKALGLTPWVARVPLPGAAPSPLLDWALETEQAAAPVVEGTPLVALPQSLARSSGAAVSVAPVAVPSEPPAGPGSSLDPNLNPNLGSGQTTSPPPSSPVPAEAAPLAADAALVFTLEAHLAGDTWLVFQQEDAQAPGLGRHTGALAASLLALFDSRPARPRRFYCPLAGQAMNAGQAHQALQAFFTGLARNSGGQRLLLCLEAGLARALFDSEPYQLLQVGELPALLISSLKDMLEDAPRHKGASWRAMREQGFDGRRQ